MAYFDFKMGIRSGALVFLVLVTSQTESSMKTTPLAQCPLTWATGIGQWVVILLFCQVVQGEQKKMQDMQDSY